MPRHAETRALPYTPTQMFELVADVRRYPEFLPWVTGVRVREEREEMLVADLLVGFRALRERFTSRVVKERPGRIHVDYVEGPLAHLRNDWVFREGGGGGCLVDFSVDFASFSRLFQAVAGQVFDRAVRRMIGAFEARAAALYGLSSPPDGSSSSSARMLA